MAEKKTGARLKKRLIALLSLLAIGIVALLAGRSKAYKTRARQIEARKRENRKEMREVKAEMKQVAEEKTVALGELDTLQTKRQKILAEAKRLEAKEIDNAERQRRLMSDPSEW